MSGATITSAGSVGRLAVTLAGQWWRQVTALAAACGIVATTIAGGLAVGSSLQGSLRSLALARLGGIEAAVIGESFFTASLVERLAAAAAARGGPRHIVPALVMPVTVSAGSRTIRALLLACDEPAALGHVPASPAVEPEGVLLNRGLAEGLGIDAGDPVVLRLPRRSSVPADSPLGRRTGASDGRRLAVTAVLPDRGLGRFSLRPTVSTEPLVVTSLETARRILRRADAVNAIFAVGMPPAGDAAAWLERHLEPGLPDYGLTLETATAEPPSLRLTSDRLLVQPAVDAAAAAVLGPLGGRPTLVMLANALTVGERSDAAAASVPYSTVLGIPDARLPVGDLVDAGGEPIGTPPDDGIIINRWLADDLAAQGRPVAAGDVISLVFFEPETVHGRVVETAATLRITGIAEMRGAATVREVVPDVAGITDEESISDWDPPFPFDASRVRSTPPRDEDDRYWKRYRGTPKAFVSLATARRLAGSRFGETTAWLVPDLGPATDPDVLAPRLADAIRPEALGLIVVPLVADALEASRGSTPFGSLFLALSSFIVVAGLLLEWLLFGLLAAAHRRDLGLLAAVGWPPRLLVRFLVSVGGLAAVLGAAVGTLLAVPWARLLLGLLGNRWTAQVEPAAAERLFAGPPATAALAAGGAAATIVSLVALAVAARRVGGMPPLAMLQGSTPPPRASRRGRRAALAVAGLGIATAAATAATARGGSPEAAVVAFFAAGLAALAGLLALAWLWISAAAAGAAVRTLPGLARRNLGFAPTRAFSVAAIVAAATFLVVAVSSFSQRPPADPSDRAGPTGGWTEIVSFGEPTGVDPADPAERSDLGLSRGEEELLSACEFARLRTSGGGVAACTNLYATPDPAVLGVGPGFVARGGFAFTAHALLDQPLAAGTAGNPWQLLERPRPAGAAVPAILDEATARWGLRLGGLGSRFTLAADSATPVEFEIVGLLAPGILQGFVIVSERDFERVFPARSGYGMALIDASGVPAEARAGTAAAAAAAWADAGASITSAVGRLASLQAVQNTFLAGFQALGALGLLLGTAGVAAVQIQGTFERIGSLAVMRAVGFSIARVRLMLVLETVFMVVLGLVAGGAAALLAVAPAIADAQARLPVGGIALTGGLALGAAGLAAAAAARRAVIPDRPLAG